MEVLAAREDAYIPVIEPINSTINEKNSHFDSASPASPPATLLFDHHHNNRLSRHGVMFVHDKGTLSLIASMRKLRKLYKAHARQVERLGSLCGEEVSSADTPSSDAHAEDCRGDFSPLPTTSRRMRAVSAPVLHTASSARRPSEGEGSSVGTRDGDAQTARESVRVHPCTWPGCSKMFDRIKSLSTHLKWHDGRYAHRAPRVIAARRVGTTALSRVATDCDDTIVEGAVNMEAEGHDPQRLKVDLSLPSHVFVPSQDGTCYTRAAVLGERLGLSGRQVFVETDGSRTWVNTRDVLADREPCMSQVGNCFCVHVSSLQSPNCS